MHEHQFIGEYPVEYWSSREWGTKLYSWCVILGLTDVPDQVEEPFIVEALMNDYKGHSFAEIEVALKMVVMNEFSTTIEAYNKLNLRFLAKMMNEYRKYRKDVANKYEEIRIAAMKPLPPPEPTEFEVDIATVQDMWSDYIRLWRDIFVYPGQFKAELLCKIGILSSEEIHEHSKVINREILDEYSKTTSERRKRELGPYIDDKEKRHIFAERTAKANFYTNWLQKLKEEKITFEQFCDLVESKVFALHGVQKLQSPH